MADTLGGDEIRAWVDAHPDWKYDDNALVRSIDAPTFPAGIEFVGRVAEAAEARNHHPDIDIRWRTVTLRLSTHSAGGITTADLELADVIDGLA